MPHSRYKPLTTVPKSKSDSNDKATEELSVVIDDLLDQLGAKFSTISEELLAKSEFLGVVSEKGSPDL